MLPYKPTVFMEIVEVKCFSVLYLNHKMIPYIG